MGKEKIYNDFLSLNFNRINEKQKLRARNYIIDSLMEMYKINIIHGKYFKCKIFSHNCYNLESNNNNYQILLTAHYDTHGYRQNYIQSYLLRKLLSNKFMCSLIALLLALIIFRFSIILKNSPKICSFLTLTIIFLLYKLLFWGFPLCLKFSSNSFNPAPIHDDNNSGVIALIYIAKLLYEKGHSNKIKLLFTDCEEKGMLGSKLFVQNNFENLKNKIIINLDCVGRGSNIFITFKNNSKLAKELQCFFLSKNISTTLSTKSCSDDKSFQEFGFNSVGIIRGDKDPHGNKLIHWTHTPHDTLDNINICYVTEIIELVTEFIENNL